MNMSSGQEYFVVFRALIIGSWIAFGALFAGTVMAQAKIGDWKFRLEGKGTEIEKRIALTPAQADSSNESIPNLVIRRVKPESPVELLITDTHDKETMKCDYKGWKIMIDKTDIPVLGYSVEPTTTELKARWGTPEDELWSLFRKGLKLTVQVEQKCDSFSGKPNLASYIFSLRGSRAAFELVLGSAE